MSFPFSSRLHENFNELKRLAEQKKKGNKSSITSNKRFKTFFSLQNLCLSELAAEQSKSSKFAF